MFVLFMSLLFPPLYLIRMIFDICVFGVGDLPIADIVNHSYYSYDATYY